MQVVDDINMSFLFTVGVISSGAWVVYALDAALLGLQQLVVDRLFSDGTQATIEGCGAATKI